jgi:hypothetical protein
MRRRRPGGAGPAWAHETQAQVGACFFCTSTGVDCWCEHGELQCGVRTCGGIDPYTLMAPHGSRQTRWANSPERVAQVFELLGEPYGANRDYLTVKET